MAYNQMDTRGMRDFVQTRNPLTALKVPTNGQIVQTQQSSASAFNDPNFEAFMAPDNVIDVWKDNTRFITYQPGDSYPNTTPGDLSPAQRSIQFHRSGAPPPQMQQMYQPSPRHPHPTMYYSTQSRVMTGEPLVNEAQAYTQLMSHTLPQVETQHKRESSLNDTTDDANLDYESTQLFGLDFKTLQEQSFDEIPHVTTNTSAESHAPEDIERSLRALLQSDSQIAEDYFRSMSTADWELSGVWLKAEIDSITDELIALRSARRATAKTYESKAADWHTDVLNKMKAVSDAKESSKSAAQSILDCALKRKR